jgi:hypothetical protein
MNERSALAPGDGVTGGFAGGSPSTRLAAPRSAPLSRQGRGKNR